MLTGLYTSLAFLCHIVVIIFKILSKLTRKGLNASSVLVSVGPDYLIKGGAAGPAEPQVL